MRGISSPALFELRALLACCRASRRRYYPSLELPARCRKHVGRMAECRGLAPLARRHALFSGQARSAWPVDIPNSIALVLLVLVIEAGVRGRGGERGPGGRRNWSAWQDSHLQPFRLERNASALGYTRDKSEIRNLQSEIEVVPTAGFAPALCAF